MPSVCVQGVKPKDFATQINLSMENCWGIVRALVDVVAAMDDGKYLLVKCVSAHIDLLMTDKAPYPLAFHGARQPYAARRWLPATKPSHAARCAELSSAIKS